MKPNVQGNRNEIMRVAFLTNNEIAYPLFEWLCKEEEYVIKVEEKVTLEYLKKENINFIISFNYKYILGKEIVEAYKLKIINLHMSFLPVNRGAYPNFFSFIDQTVKGFTIHFIDEGLDTGDILFQKSYDFDEDKHTFSSTYNFLIHEMEEYFIEKWHEIKSAKIQSFPQSGNYTCHSKVDFNKINSFCAIDWSETISSYRLKYSYFLKKDGDGK